MPAAPLGQRVELAAFAAIDPHHLAGLRVAQQHRRRGAHRPDIGRDHDAMRSSVSTRCRQTSPSGPVQRSQSFSMPSVPRRTAVEGDRGLRLAGLRITRSSASGTRRGPVPIASSSAVGAAAARIDLDIDDQWRADLDRAGRLRAATGGLPGGEQPHRASSDSTSGIQTSPA
jgi:hypothetical protein